MATHKKLQIWNDGIGLVVRIYKITATFPSDERFGLISQLRRSAVSIPSNIAEGAARKNDTENIQFLYMALGSLSEMETQLIISQKLQYEIPDKILTEVNQLGKSINSFIKYLKSLGK